MSEDSRSCFYDICCTYFASVRVERSVFGIAHRDGLARCLGCIACRNITLNITVFNRTAIWLSKSKHFVMTDITFRRVSRIIPCRVPTTNVECLKTIESDLHCFFMFSYGSAS